MWNLHHIRRNDALGPTRFRGIALQVIVRERLLRMLQAAEEGTVFFVAAGAGCGKTTLLHQWKDRDATVVIAGLDESDNDVDALGAKILQRLATIHAPVRRLARRASGRETDWFCDVLPDLIDALRDAPAALGLDDVHILRSTQALELLRELARRWPAHGALVLSGRQRPALAGVRVPLGAPVRSITESDLEFTPDELVEIGGGRDARGLVEATGGWPAGVRAAIVATRTSFVADELSISDYIEQRVLGSFSHEEVEFLRQVALILPATPQELDAILNRDDTMIVLAGMAARGLPLLSLPAAGDTEVTMHALLQDQLIAGARRDDPDATRDLLVHAAKVTERAGRLSAAAALLERAGEESMLRAMPYRHMGHLVLNGRVNQIAAWLSRYDEADVRADPLLAIPLTQTMRPRVEHVVRDVLAPFATDTVTILPDGATAAAAVDRLLMAYGFQGVSDVDVHLLGGWKHTARVRRAWELYANDRVDEAWTLLAQPDASLHKYVVTDAARLAKLSLLSLDADRLDDAAAYVAESQRLLRDAHSQDAGMTFFIDAAAMAVARTAGDLDRASELLNVTRSKMAMIGDATKLEYITTLLEVARLSLVRDVPGGSVREALREASEMARAWPGPVPRFHREIAELAAFAASNRWKRSVSLSTAELRVVRYLPSHYSLVAIAEKLHLSLSTVKSHCRSIYRKFGVRRRSDAVAAAVRLGILPSSVAALPEPRGGRSAPGPTVTQR